MRLEKEAASVYEQFFRDPIADERARGIRNSGRVVFRVWGYTFLLRIDSATIDICRVAKSFFCSPSSVSPFAPSLYIGS